MERRSKARRILVTTDLSVLGNLALPLALAQASKASKILLLHTVTPVYSAGFAYGPEAVVPVYDPESTRHLVKREGLALKRMVSGLKGVETKVLESEQPAKAICDEARRFKADLLVMSTHGRGGLGRILFGSVAQKVLTRYKGEVLLLRPRSGSK